VQLVGSSLHLMPMALDGSHSLESARAAALASHSAAGLASSAGLRAAARLLRSSEALARSAVAAILDAASRGDGAPHAHGRGAAPRVGAPPRAHGHGSAPQCAPGASPASQPRRRRRKKKIVEIDLNVDDGPEVIPLGPSVGAVPSLSADASVFVPAARPPRVLVARHSRERTPPPRASSAPSSSSARPSSASVADLLDFAVGSAVVFTGLVSRADLVGVAGKVLSFDGAASRYAVMVDVTGESVKVLARNLTASSLF
jgi:hypothetical protein